MSDRNTGRMTITDRYIEVRKVAAQVIGSGVELDEFRRFFVKSSLDEGPTISQRAVLAHLESDGCLIEPDRKAAWITQTEKSNRPAESWLSWTVWTMTVDGDIARIGHELFKAWKSSGGRDESDPLGHLEAEWDGN